MADNEIVNGIINTILSPILAVLNWIIELLFSNNTILMILFFILVNIIAILLMKRDKQYAENGERRIKEATLLIVAIVGGSLGMYYAMFKYKHKTLHNKFSIGIPIIIVMQFAFASYLLMSGILG